MKIKHLVVRDEHGDTVWRVSVEGESDVSVHALGLNILRTLPPGYSVTAEAL